MKKLDVEKYLERIGYRGARDPSAETLRALQRAHLLAVPFENLSIHLGEPIVLAEDALSEKVIERRRGGFCYELNGLFAALLRELGFRVEMLSAGVFGGEEFGPDFDHMTLAVTLNERWLADVGFGDSFDEPLLLDDEGEQWRGGLAYRITQEADSRRVLSRRSRDGAWQPQYRFSMEPRLFADYEEMCRFHQTSPRSHFTRNRVCTLLMPTGRVTLSEMRLISTAADGARDERELSTPEEYRSALREHFGMSL